MRPHLRIRQSPTRWLFGLAAALLCYIIVLLVHAHLSQTQLQQAAEQRILTESRHVVAVLEDVLSAQRQFASDLARTHEIEVFLANRALGMSMRYGLNANLFDVEEGFRNKMAEKTALGRPTYQRILFLGEDHVALADTAPGTPAPAVARAKGDQTQLLIDESARQLLVVAPVVFGGRREGTVVTVSDAALLALYLGASSAEQGQLQLLLSASGTEVPPPHGAEVLPRPVTAVLARMPSGKLAPTASLGLAAGQALPGDMDLALRTPVDGTALSVLTLLPQSLPYGGGIARAFLPTVSVLPIVLLLGALWVRQLSQRARKLQADVLDSNRSRAELKDRNDALTVEIARRETAERSLRASEERYRTYVEHAPEGIFVADAEGRFVDINPSAAAIVGHDRADLLQMTVGDLAPPGRAPEYLAQLKRILSKGQLALELALRRPDGTERLVQLRALRLPGQRVMGYCSDITERKLAEDQIRHLAFFDPLTGLPNRRLLMDRLRHAVAVSARGAEHAALLMLDLDHFKDLNDTQGHDMGDRLLVAVAQRLVGVVRAEDTVARLGGDEYVVVAEGLGHEATAAAVRAMTLAEKVHAALSQPYTLDEGRPAHHSTPSIGVALFLGHEPALDTLLKQADVALYQAKSAGRDAIRFFSPEMQASIDERTRLEAALRQGLRGQEFRLYYQPQCDMRGRTIGVEALLRWLPADSEPVPPARFIPLAEDTGLIVPIGTWVLQQACAQLRQWRGDPELCKLTLSINVSARQFHQPDFVEQVCAHLDAAGADASRLTLELTESVVLDRVDEVVSRMHTLKQRGVRFSLDDFGTGYSSLSYLKRLPLDEVKIDKSFVRDLAQDASDAAIVRAVLRMSQSLGLSVVAEGVETPQQHSLLLEFGCERFQGYLFGRPVPIDELELGAVLPTCNAALA
ncbi:MAG: EAL domain-containing protein [Rubrivivax sp.]|jgi:diguanylate cyclase (GGDEF)-like protein/PAS domain S-box-containing protein|nr:EAL domain-containing protein [Rubrivivax sp.]